MSCKYAPQIQCMASTETRNVVVDFQDRLDSGELLTGTPTATEVTTADLTIDNVAKNSSSLTVLGRSVAANQAVQFRVTGGDAGTTYVVRVTCGTDATPPQTLSTDVRVKVS